jgi:hypothetical protein
MPKKPLHLVGGFLVREQSVKTFSENLRAQGSKTIKRGDVGIRQLSVAWI